MVLDVPNNRIPRTIVVQVSKPGFDCSDGMVSFSVHHLSGNVVGIYEFDASRRVTVTMLKSKVKDDIEGYKPGSHQVSCVHTVLFCSKGLL